ncbi:uncharacterized protein TM35_000201210 [Trypanosoma theileri]|uniref:Uncharacterized protein n=1 Tax=Trypanosoma theileri TaxID=67003 RepID=A0A1X0NSN8_9TRYP|nr:uncharacterized protein TM35_000201210 [Trypanosoma theileri]ORC87712.1 hypothetical protein TM35_000201210 [Trypanosoma theileri]
MPLWEDLREHFRGRVCIPGVVYSEELRVSQREGIRNAEIPQTAESTAWRGGLRNVRMSTAPALLLRSAASAADVEGPATVPYTFAERVGIVPVHPARVRPRPYYHPTTDFGLYDYDEISPEEKALTARWMAKVFEFNSAVPLGVLCATGCIVLPLHSVYRMPLLVAAGATGVVAEITRAYMSAAPERQDLDDFILAKEIWYIKNVETYQLDIPRIPKGREAEYHAYLDGSISTVQQLPDELVDALH